MTKKQFKHDLLRGLGSALLALQANSNPGKYRDIVLYGCLHNTAYDPQCEGDRGWYLCQAVQLVGDKKAIESAVIQKIFRVREDHWLFDQLASILYYFALEGSEIARATLYQQYENMLNELSLGRKNNHAYLRRDMFDDLCIWLILLDKWSAFKRIVQDISEILLPKDQDFFQCESFYGESKNKFGKKRVDDYLRSQAEKSPFICAYYEKAKAWDEHRCADARFIPTLEQVVSKAQEQGRSDDRWLDNGSRWFARLFVKNASLEEIEKLARAAMDEPDAKIQFELLWPFRMRAIYSFPDAFLLRLCQSGDERLRNTAYKIIEHNPSPKTRELALSLIQSGEDIEHGTSLLARTLRSEDESLLCEVVKTAPIHRNKWVWHSIFMAAKDGIAVMHGKPKTDILEYIYRYTLCGICRKYIVRLMRKKKVLTEKILQECQYDSNKDIRTFAGRIVKSRKLSV